MQNSKQKPVELRNLLLKRIASLFAIAFIVIAVIMWCEASAVT
jgi:hypothetical protein